MTRSSAALATAPVLRVVGWAGQAVALELGDAGTMLAGEKPTGAVAATVFSCVGDVPPLPTAPWRFECSTSRTRFNVSLERSIAPGQTMWLAAAWLDASGEAGPLCRSVRAPAVCGAALVPARYARAA